MTEVLRLIGALVFGNLFLVALVLTLGALFPQRLRQTRRVADLMPGRALGVGVINTLFFGVLALAFSALADNLQAEILRLPALLFFALLSFGLSFGLAGMAVLVGERLRPTDSELRRTVWGTLALSLACTFPLIGWFGLLVYAGCVGLGAFIIGFFYREPGNPPVSNP